MSLEEGHCRKEKSMKQVLIAGAGHIGTTIMQLLSNTGDYQVYLADIDLQHIRKTCDKNPTNNVELVELDINNNDQVKQFFEKHNIDAIVSCLPYFCNIQVANIAKQYDLYYFDLTEDVQIAKKIDELAKNTKTAFIPQCGLAPGLIDIIASDLIQKFADPETVKLRCGALPINSANPLQYCLTWSIDGLINEYGNDCEVLRHGKLRKTPGLSDIEEIQIDGALYEAFNTSGGLGSLALTYQNKVKNLDYKSIRYPGHCEKMRFLMNGLKLNNDRETLKHILKNAIPGTHQDVVIVYVSVSGHINGEYLREGVVKKYYPAKIHDCEYAAIQLTTASSACAVIDIVLSNKEKYQGRITQESFTYHQLTENQFGDYLKGNAQRRIEDSISI
jgi:saccharopine dehydrogenase-like NADP-dependent oxidoreductase